MSLPRLTIELVPSTAWYTNVRSNVPKEEWDRLRKIVYAEAGHVCEICGGVGSKWPVECHEVWEYDDETHTQTLLRLIALCPRCHEVKHIGRANIHGNFRRALEHLAEVNEWPVEDAEEYVTLQFLTWQERSQHDWKLDILSLSEYGEVDGRDEEA